MLGRALLPVAATGLVLFGAVVAGPPLMQLAKAWAAPVLIERAWEAGEPDRPARAPWPWADGRPVAVLSAPDLGITRYVLGGASARVLAFGPARLSGSGNERGLGTTVLFGHRDTHFRFLRRIRPGQRLTYTGADRIPRRYEVAATRVADARTLAVPDDPDALVLVTCWPFEAAALGGPERFVVIAWRLSPSAGR